MYIYMSVYLIWGLTQSKGIVNIDSYLPGIVKFLNAEYEITHQIV